MGRLPGAAKSGALGSLTFDPPRLPVKDYLKRQSRFACALIAEILANVDAYWAGVS
jgi:hypothetical protein